MHKDRPDDELNPRSSSKNLVEIRGNPDVYSTPARVLLRVAPAACLVDFTGDGVLNFFEVSEFILAFTDDDPAADLNNDGTLNFFDVSVFLGSYSAGCP